MEEAKLFAEFQLKVDSLSNKNVGEIYKWLEESTILKNYKISSIISLLLQYAYVRPKSITTISFLGAAILRKLTQEEQLRILLDNFSQSTSPFGIIASANALFMMNIIDLLKIPYETVIDNFESLFTTKLFNRDDHFALFIFLCPTFEVYKPELYRSIVKQYKESVPAWVQNLSQIKKDDWAQMKENRKENGVKDGLSYTIRKDDVVSIRMVSLNPSFKLDQTVKFTIYEPNIQIVAAPNILEYALFCGSLKIVKFVLPTLLQHCPEIARDPQYARYAVAGGSLECVTLLRQNGFSFDGCLHVATIYHQRQMFDWLLDQTEERELSKSNVFGTVLDSALLTGNFDIALQCLSHGADLSEKDAKGRAPLHRAVESGFLPTVNMILACDSVDVNEEGPFGMSALGLAVESNSIDIVRRLLAIPSVDVNHADEAGLSSVGVAACSGYIEILELLLQREDIDVNLKDEESVTPIYSAYEAEQYEACRVLAEDPRTDIATPNEAGMNMLHLAASGINFGLLQAALKRCDVNVADAEGHLPVHYAAGNELEYLKAVLDAGADPTAVDSSGRTPLHYAVRNSALDSLKFLIELPQVDVNQGDDSGLTPLHYAANMCNNEVLRVLLKCDRVNPNAVSKMGAATAIMISIAKLDEEGVKAFLELDNIDVTTAVLRSNSMKGAKAKIIRTLLRNYQKSHPKQE